MFSLCIDNVHTKKQIIIPASALTVAHRNGCRVNEFVSFPGEFLLNFIPSAESIFSLVAISGNFNFLM